MTGFGRPGNWFAMNHWDVVPDIMDKALEARDAYTA